MNGRMVLPPQDVAALALRVFPAGAFYADPPRSFRRDRCGGKNVWRKEALEDERPAEMLGLCHIAGLSHEGSEALIAYGEPVDAVRPQADGAGWPLPVYWQDGPRRADDCVSAIDPADIAMRAGRTLWRNACKFASAPFRLGHAT